MKKRLVLISLSIITFMSPFVPGVRAASITVNQTLNPGEILTIDFQTNASIITASGLAYDTLVFFVATGLNSTDVIGTNLFDGATLLASNPGQFQNVFGGEIFTWVKSLPSIFGAGNPTQIDFTHILDGTIQGELDVFLVTSTPVNIGLVQLFLGKAIDPGSFEIFGGGDEVTITSSSIAPAPVPEPATMFLFGSGLIGLIGYGRKKFLKR